MNNTKLSRDIFQGWIFIYIVRNVFVIFNVVIISLEQNLNRLTYIV